MRRLILPLGIYTTGLSLLTFSATRLHYTNVYPNRTVRNGYREYQYKNNVLIRDTRYIDTSESKKDTETLYDCNGNKIRHIEYFGNQDVRKQTEYTNTQSSKLVRYTSYDGRNMVLDDGEIIVYKHGYAGNTLQSIYAKLIVPDDAKRTTTSEYKATVEKGKILEIRDTKDNKYDEIIIDTQKYYIGDMIIDKEGISITKFKPRY